MEFIPFSNLANRCKHYYITRQKEKNVFRLRKYNSEFGKKVPYNIAFNLCDLLRINLNSFQNYNLYIMCVIYKIIHLKELTP